MENPATWGPLEKAIDEAMREAAEARAQKVIGLSTVRRIADKLREKGLVKDTSDREALVRAERELNPPHIT